jgi:hypothetical protein
MFYILYPFVTYLLTPLYKAHSNLLVNMKRYNTVYSETLTQCLPACIVYATSITNKAAEILPIMLAATFVYMDHHICLCHQAGRNQFQHLP